MLTTLILKELRAVIAGPAFAVTSGVCALLILLSMLVGIREYTSSVRQYETATGLAQQDMREARSWMGMNARLFRRPDPMQIFSAGVENDVGRTSVISPWQPVKLLSAAYTNDPLFAVFRSMDVSFIVSVVLTLFAILFTFDAVNGERERGTLQLVFSNAVPRASYLLAKFAGSWLALMLPLLVPMLLGLSLLFAFGIPMTTDHWIRVGGIVGVSVLLFTFFLVFGILVSSLTRRSNVSFLVLLTSWVGLVLIIPRAGVMLAGQFVPVPTVAEMQNRQDGYAKDRWDSHLHELTERWRARQAQLSGLEGAARKAKSDEMEWTWAEEDDKLRKRAQADIDENARKLTEDLRNQKREQERLAFTLARFSPVAAYQLAVMDLAGTDPGIKSRYEDAMNQYRTVFNAYRDRKQKASGASGGIRISVDSNTGVKIDAGRDIALDISDRPEFEHPRPTLADAFGPTFTDVGLLAVLTLLCFAAAFAAFVRYDVR